MTPGSHHRRTFWPRSIVREQGNNLRVSATGAKREAELARLSYVEIVLAHEGRPTSLSSAGGDRLAKADWTAICSELIDSPRQDHGKMRMPTMRDPERSGEAPRPPLRVIDDCSDFAS